MTKKIGVLLAGCGVLDGSEIHEAVVTLLCLDRKGAEAVCMAPDADQHDVINHLTEEQASEKRNILLESARIARGDIKDIKEVQTDDLDALIIPGGFGAAKNLSDFALKGPDAHVNPDVQRIVQEMFDRKKPIGAICISPATVARILSAHTPEVTIGNDAQTADAIGKMGAKHIPCTVEDIVIDRKNRIVTTPAYMLGPGIKDVAAGIEKLVEEILTMAG